MCQICCDLLDPICWGSVGDLLGTSVGDGPAELPISSTPSAGAPSFQTCQLSLRSRQNMKQAIRQTVPDEYLTNTRKSLLYWCCNASTEKELQQQ